jgi:hypothetical protein
MLESIVSYKSLFPGASFLLNFLLERLGMILCLFDKIFCFKDLDFISTCILRMVKCFMTKYLESWEIIDILDCSITISATYLLWMTLNTSFVLIDFHLFISIYLEIIYHLS